jgi:uncharacterized membrane protein YfcA
MPEQWQTDVLLCLAALAAGVMNSIAGGGTLLTFPALLAAGVSPVVANATSTVALVPGSLSGAWGYRSEICHLGRWTALLIVPSLLGGAVGSLLVLTLNESYFKAVVPWLILAATLLFLFQPAISRWAGIGMEQAPPAPGAVVGVLFFQFLVSVYGGYFGAGIGILMLSSLGLMGVGDIHRMNALKTLLAACINGVSVVIFVLGGKVQWRLALLMAVAAIAGGYLGARVARRLNRNVVRWVVILIGLVLAGHLFYKNWTEGPDSTSPVQPSQS